MATGELKVSKTSIPGMLIISLPVHEDSRGWFKENWQREKMVALGLPDFHPLQNNISFNDKAGATRGIHAEPWDKYISVATGQIFGAWVDLRAGSTFGTVFTAEIDPSAAVFVPRGVGNAYQTLVDNTSYVYLVNEHWSADAQSKYTFLNLADETVNIPWPIPLTKAEQSEKDLAHPSLADVEPMKPKRTLVLGANGQLGNALRGLIRDADFTTRDEIDLASPNVFENFPWEDYDTVINAAAYTRVDEAETPEGRIAAWASNAQGLIKLSRAATEHRLTVVHVSSDYVFDGSKKEPYSETEPFSPLNVYGQSKAAGDAAMSTVPRHYIVRTSWVIGEGSNFVRTMVSLAERGVDPTVVNDQCGRLSFSTDIANGINHLLQNHPEYGTYNITGDGPTMTWAEVARHIFTLTGHDSARVNGVPTEEYFADRRAAPRPRSSVLSLSKIKSTGFSPRDGVDALRNYLESLKT